MCASGKTFLSEELSSFFDALIIHTDDFYLPRGEKDLTLSNDGNIDLKRLKEEIIDNLNKDTLVYRKFSCQKQEMNSSITLNSKPLIIIEGSYSLNPYFGKYYDLSIFMKINPSTQLERIKKRNPNNFNDFLNKWIVLENRYNAFYKIEDNANLIIENN